MTRASRRKHHVIYKTTCLVTGRYYIGMHSTDDLNDGYTGSGQRLWKSIKKHGKDQHLCEILEHHPDREMLAKREEELNTDLLKDPMCMNLRTGGTENLPGFEIKPDVGAKVSAKLKAHYSSPEGQATKQKLSAAIAGKPKPTETRERMSMATRGVKKSAEHRASMSRSRIGVPQSPERRARTRTGRERPCTLNGTTIYPSHSALVKIHGHGKSGGRSPNLRYL